MDQWAHLTISGEAPGSRAGRCVSSPHFVALSHLGPIAWLSRTTCELQLVSPCF